MSTIEKNCQAHIDEVVVSQICEPEQPEPSYRDLIRTTPNYLAVVDALYADEHFLEHDIPDAMVLHRREKPRTTEFSERAVDFVFTPQSRGIFRKLKFESRPRR